MYQPLIETIASKVTRYEQQMQALRELCDALTFDASAFTDEQLDDMSETLWIVQMETLDFEMVILARRVESLNFSVWMDRHPMPERV